MYMYIIHIEHVFYMCIAMYFVHILKKSCSYMTCNLKPL